MCVDFSRTANLGGDYESNKPVYVQAIALDPCKVVNPGDCEVLYNGVMTSTLTDNGPVQEFFKDYVLELSYLEDKVEVTNFEKPIQKSLVSNFNLRFNSLSQTWTKIDFRQVEVESTSGFWLQSTTSDSGLQFEISSYNRLLREPGSEQQVLYLGERGPVEGAFYGYLFFGLSNRSQKFVRQYASYIDTLQDVGGVGEILIFTFVFLMLYHHEFIMELFLLNNAILLSHLNSQDKDVRRN